MNKNKSGADTMYSGIVWWRCSESWKIDLAEKPVKIVGLKIDAHNFFLLVWGPLALNGPFRFENLCCEILKVFFSVGFQWWMNVESSWYLEEGTIECRNVGFKYFVRIKYCSFIIQISIMLELFLFLNLVCLPQGLLHYRPTHITTERDSIEWRRF